MDAPWAYIKARLFEDWIIREIPLKNSTPKRIIALACPYLSLWLFHITLAQDVPRFLSLDTISFWRIDCLIITSWIQDKFLEFSMLIKLPNYLLYCIWWELQFYPRYLPPYSSTITICGKSWVIQGVPSIPRKSWMGERIPGPI